MEGEFLVSTFLVTQVKLRVMLFDYKKNWHIILSPYRNILLSIVNATKKEIEKKSNKWTSVFRALKNIK
jgi:hypothetical protein